MASPPQCDSSRDDAGSRECTVQSSSPSLCRSLPIPSPVPAFTSNKPLSSGKTSGSLSKGSTQNLPQGLGWGGTWAPTDDDKREISRATGESAATGPGCSGANRGVIYRSIAREHGATQLRRRREMWAEREGSGNPPEIPTLESCSTMHAPCVISKPFGWEGRTAFERVNVARFEGRRPDRPWEELTMLLEQAGAIQVE
jgi:hypothetical protein